MLKLLYGRGRRTDGVRIRSALTSASERHFRNRLKGLKRHRGELDEIPDLVAELSRLAGLREHIREESDIERAVTLLRRRPSGERGCVRLTVHTEMLHALHHRLFPAERMAVIGGRATDDGTMLSGLFDVTRERESSRAYTRAEPEKLGEALRAMDASGTTLAAWAHSHPGAGPPATYPSPTDRTQYDAWSKDYGELLCLIVTVDGYVRVWGGRTDSVVLVGTGVEGVGDGVYKLGF